MGSRSFQQEKDPGPTSNLIAMASKSGGFGTLTGGFWAPVARKQTPVGGSRYRHIDLARLGFRCIGLVTNAIGMGIGLAE